MKKIILYLAFVATVMACGSKGEEKTVMEAEGLEFDSIVADTLVRLTSEKGAPEAKVHLSLMFATKGDNAKAVNDTLLHSGLVVPDYLSDIDAKGNIKAALDTFLIRFANEYKKNYAPLYQRDREHKASYNIVLNCKAKINSYKDGIINYQVETYNYAGGKDGLRWTLSHNIEAKTARILTLDDVLVPGYEKQLKEKVVEALCDKFDADDLKELGEKGVMYDIEPYPSNNFILKDGAIEFIYVDSEIAAHDKGEIRIEVKGIDDLWK